MGNKGSFGVIKWKLFPMER